MSRRFVSQLAHQETIDQIFLASEKQLRPNRAGNLYLQYRDTLSPYGSEIMFRRSVDGGASFELPVVNVVAFLLILVSVIPVYFAQRIGGEAIGITR